MSEQNFINKPYSTEINELSDLKNYIGKEVGLSEWTIITQDQIDAFAKITDDNQWIHINPELCKKHSPYKKPVAHGFLVLSLAPKFCYETLKFNNVSMGVNYGCDKVRINEPELLFTKIEDSEIEFQLEKLRKSKIS